MPAKARYDGWGSADAISGCQWGDEAKGKVIDFLLGHREYAINVRYNGGPNAGHTVVVGDRRYALHHIPSGAVRGLVPCMMGPGTVIYGPKLFGEIDTLEGAGIHVTPENFHISDRAQIITGFNKKLDALTKGKIGTTGRGIGPTYSGEADRTNPRVMDLFDEQALRELSQESMQRDNFMIERFYGDEPLDIEREIGGLLELGERLKPFTLDATETVTGILKSGKDILLEAGQGFWLDLKHGTYPFVTSSHPLPAGACVSLGIPPQVLRNVVGVTRAYNARVGEGPFPGEWGDYKDVKEKEDPNFGGTTPGPLTNEEISKALAGDRYWMGRWVRVDGGEFGTTTGRPRRTGEPNWGMLRRAGDSSGVTEWGVTKIDVMGGKPVRPILGYKVGGTVKDFHFGDGGEPVYGKGYVWPRFTDDMCERMVEEGFDAMPEDVRNYLLDLAEFTGIPVGFASISPDREMTVTKDVLERTSERIR